MQIETERLILREMNEEDFDDLYCVLADSDIMQHYPYTFDEKRVRGWIEKNQERYQIFGFGLWSVCIKENGKIICMKASEAEEEIEQAKKAINVLGGTIKNVETFDLPQSDIGRTIITIEKAKKTPTKYPRKAGTPSKEPIK